MNYELIYQRFISDRRGRELAGYSERHHILPRCMGGGDEAENLIRLTPEDHYFAHLLLAYAYGGKNWVAVHAMCHLSNDYSKGNRSKLAARMQFGHVRRALAQHYRDILQGPDGKIADQTRYQLKHFDGRVAEGNRFELSAATGVPRQQLSAVLLGAKKSAHGWFSEQHNPEGLTPSQLLSRGLRSKETTTLFHADGRTWTGTVWDFRDQFGAGLTFQHEQGCVQGWYRSKEQADSHGSLKKSVLSKALKARGSISGASNPNADRKVYSFQVLATGEIIVATKTEIRERFGIKSANLCAIFNGKQKQTGGIGLAQVELAV